MADLGAAKLTKNFLPKLLLKNEHFVCEKLSLVFFFSKSNTTKLQNKSSSEDYHVTKLFEKKIKNREISVWKLLAPKITKKRLASSQWFFDFWLHSKQLSHVPRYFLQFLCRMRQLQDQGWEGPWGGGGGGKESPRVWEPKFFAVAFGWLID